MLNEGESYRHESISEVEIVEYDVHVLKQNGISQIFFYSIISF